MNVLEAKLNVLQPSWQHSSYRVADKAGEAGSQGWRSSLCWGKLCVWREGEKGGDAGYPVLREPSGTSLRGLQGC